MDGGKTDTRAIGNRMRSTQPPKPATVRRLKRSPWRNALAMFPRTVTNWCLYARQGLGMFAGLRVDGAQPRAIAMGTRMIRMLVANQAECRAWASAC
jgi:hypothetical protein